MGNRNLLASELESDFPNNWKEMAKSWKFRIINKFSSNCRLKVVLGLVVLRITIIMLDLPSMDYPQWQRDSQQLYNY